MSEACCMRERAEKCMQNFNQKIWKTEIYLEDLDVEGKDI
jgi:hypothetical protein